MDILLLASEFPPIDYGLANYSYNIAKHLGRNNEVMVATLPIHPTVERYLLNLGFLYSMEKRISKLKKNGNIDIVYTITFGPQFSVIGLYVKMLNLPFVSHGVGSDIYTSHPMFILARRIAYSISDKLICGASSQKEMMLSQGARSEKVHVILGGVDKEIFRPLHTERDELRKSLKLEEKFVLLCIGRLVKRKGFDDALKALTYLKNIDDIVLLIVGNGPERTYLEELTRTLALGNKVRFLGFVSSESLPMIYSVADLIVAPFKSIGKDMEGFPLVVQEAQACGVPVVSTLSAGLPDLVEDNVSGFLVPESSPRRISEKVRELYENVELRRKMGQNARKRAETILDWTITVGKIESLLREARVS